MKKKKIEEFKQAADSMVENIPLRRDAMSQLNEIYEKALKERDDLLAEIVPLQVEEEALRAKIRPLEAKLKEIREKIVAIETPRLRELSEIISSLAPKAKRLQAEGGKMGVKM